MSDQLHPLRGDLVYDRIGAIRCMGVAEGYVLCRRKGCLPWVMFEKDWKQMRDEQHLDERVPGGD